MRGVVYSNNGELLIAIRRWLAQPSSNPGLAWSTFSLPSALLLYLSAKDIVTDQSAPIYSIGEARHLFDRSRSSIRTGDFLINGIFVQFRAIIEADITEPIEFQRPHL